MEISAKVSDLKIHHPDYDADGIEDRCALIEGGDAFDQRKARFMRERASDSINDQGKRRLKSFNFSPRLSNVVQTIAGACIRATPHIDSENEFYKALNESATDDGEDVPSMAFNLILQAETQKRAYLAVDFSDADNPKFAIINARTIDNWGKDENGNPWYRTYTKEVTQPMSGKPGKPVEKWKYFTADFTQEFTYSESDIPTGNQYEPVAKSGEKIPNSMGYAPIWPMRKNCYLMGQLADLFIARLNRQCGITWLLDQTAFPVPVVKTSNAIGNCVLSELNGFQLQPGEDFIFVSPSPDSANVQSNDLAALDREIYAGLQGFSGADIKDAQRVATGVLASATVGLKGILLRNMGAARDCINAALDCICEARGDDVITIDGLDDCDADSLDEKIQRILGIQDIVGFPKSSRAALMADAAKSLTPDVDGKTIDAEAKAGAQEDVTNGIGTGRPGSDQGGNQSGSGQRGNSAAS